LYNLGRIRILALGQLIKNKVEVRQKNAEKKLIQSSKNLLDTRHTSNSIKVSDSSRKFSHDSSRKFSNSNSMPSVSEINDNLNDNDSYDDNENYDRNHNRIGNQENEDGNIYNQEITRKNSDINKLKLRNEKMNKTNFEIKINTVVHSMDLQKKINAIRRYDVYVCLYVCVCICVRRYVCMHTHLYAYTQSILINTSLYTFFNLLSPSNSYPLIFSP
jgi:hypothetical protein